MLLARMRLQRYPQGAVVPLRDKCVWVLSGWLVFNGLYIGYSEDAGDFSILEEKHWGGQDGEALVQEAAVLFELTRGDF
jgi:hypothetical protein